MFIEFIFLALSQVAILCSRCSNMLHRNEQQTGTGWLVGIGLAVIACVVLYTRCSVAVHPERQPNGVQHAPRCATPKSLKHLCGPYSTWNEPLSRRPIEDVVVTQYNGTWLSLYYCHKRLRHVNTSSLHERPWEHVVSFCRCWWA